MIFFDDEIFINIDSAFPYLKTSESDSNSFGDIREKLTLGCFEKYISMGYLKKCSIKSDFDGFINFEVNINDYPTLIKSKRLNVNTTAWNSYTNQLIQHFFPGYLYDKSMSNSQTVRFFKKLNTEWYIGIEYIRNSINRSKKSRFFEFPYFNIVLAKYCYGKKNQKDTPYEQNKKILPLGILGNPFFYRPALTPMEYYVILERKYHCKPNSKITGQNTTYCDYVPDINETAILSEENGKVVIRYRKEEELCLKNYICFYIDILSKTTVCYLNYIEKTLLYLLNKYEALNILF